MRSYGGIKRRADEGRRKQKKESAKCRDTNVCDKEDRERIILAKHRHTHTHWYIGAVVEVQCPQWLRVVPNEAKRCKNRQQ